MLSNCRALKKGTVGALIRLSAILGVRSFHHIFRTCDENHFRLKDPLVNQSAAGANFRIPIYENYSSSATKKLIDRADKECDHEFPARIYLIEGFIDSLYPPSDLIITPLIHEMYDVEGKIFHNSLCIKIGPHESPKWTIPKWSGQVQSRVKSGRTEFKLEFSYWTVQKGLKWS